MKFFNLFTFLILFNHPFYCNNINEINETLNNNEKVLNEYLKSNPEFLDIDKLDEIRNYFLDFLFPKIDNLRKNHIDYKDLDEKIEKISKRLIKQSEDLNKLYSLKESLFIKIYRFFSSCGKKFNKEQ